VTAMSSRPSRIARRKLGRTGLDVSVISFGTGDNAGLMVNASPDAQTAAVKRALDLGVNYFDTSPDYGKGVAEANLGRILKHLGATPIVSTKVEIMVGDVADIESKIARSLDASLERLQMDAVDVLMIHNPPRLARDASAAHWLPLTPDDMLGPALAGLEAARRAGKVKFFGFTCEGAEAAAVIPVLQSGAYDAVNVWFNLVNPTAGRTLPSGVQFGAHYDDFGGIANVAAAHGVGVAVIRPLAGGALAPEVARSGVRARHPLAGGIYTREPESFRPEADRGKAFRFLDRPERSLPQAAYAFALAHPAISTIVGGFSDIAQFEELAAADLETPFTASELARIEAVYTNNFYLGES
jgi:aryl-alcohol dehydrogenase-like predicted oxidoreductase